MVLKLCFRLKRNFHAEHFPVERFGFDKQGRWVMRQRRAVRIGVGDPDSIMAYNMEMKITEEDKMYTRELYAHKPGDIIRDCEIPDKLQLEVHHVKIRPDHIIDESQ